MKDVGQDTSLALLDFRVAGPPEAYYIPDFVTKDEEQYLLRKVREFLFPEENSNFGYTVRLENLLNRSGNN
jgi:hypothetical protein